MSRFSSLNFEEDLGAEEAKTLERDTKFLEKGTKEVLSPFQSLGIVEESYRVYVKLWIVSNDEEIPGKKGMACSFHDTYTSNLGKWKESYRFESIGFDMYCSDYMQRSRIISMTDLGQIIFLKNYNIEELSEFFDFTKPGPYRLIKRMAPQKLLEVLGIYEALNVYGLKA